MIKVQSTAARGCLLNFGIQLAMIAWLAVIVVGCAVLFPFLPRSAQQWLVVGGLIAWVTTSMVGGLLAAAILVTRRGRALDRLFAEVGPGSATGVVGRAWNGRFEGREVAVSFSKGPTFEIYVGATTDTDAGFMRSNLIASAFAGATGQDLTPVEGDLVARASDRAWLDRLVRGGTAASTLARQALIALVPADSAMGTAVLVLPDAVKYTVRHLDIYALSPDDTGGWLRRLVELAVAAEAAGPPSQRMAGGQLASRMQTSRRGLGPLMFGLGCGTALVIAAFAIISVVIFMASGDATNMGHRGR